MRLRRIAPVITIAAAGVGFCGLLPLAALPSIAEPLFPLVIAITFFVWLGGPLTLLAAGIRDLARGSSKLLFLSAFTLLQSIVGILLFWRVPRFFLDWAIMSLAIVLILLVLRRAWLWAVVGGAWTGLLAIGEVHTVSEYLSPTVRGVPNWTLLGLWIVVCVLSLTSCILGFMRRKEAY
jgi:hypothetical protein